MALSTIVRFITVTEYEKTVLIKNCFKSKISTESRTGCLPHECLILPYKETANITLTIRDE